MNKIGLNIRYKMGYQLSWVISYLVIYTVTMLIIYYWFIQSGLIATDSGGFMYRLWGIVLFHFAVSLRFKEDFDFLLTLSNTRKDIFQTFLSVALGYSLIFTIFIIFEAIIVDALNSMFGYQNFTDPFHFVAPYMTDNHLLQFIFFFLLLSSLSLFGLLMGSLFYRFGKRFTLAFWLIFSSIFVLYLPFLLLSRYQNNTYANFIETVQTSLMNFDLSVSSIYMFFLAMIFAIATFLNMRRLPQK